MQAEFAPRFMEPPLHRVHYRAVANDDRQPSLVLRDLRKQRELSLEAVAEAVEATREHLSKIERDEADASLSLLRRLANFYGVELHELFRAARPLSDDERDLIGGYRTLPPQQRQAVRSLTKSLSSPDAA